MLEVNGNYLKSLEKKHKLSKKAENNQVSFVGHKAFKDSKGKFTYRFYLPPNAKNCKVELADVAKDASGNYKVVDEIDTIEIDNQKGYVDVSAEDLGLETKIYDPTETMYLGDIAEEKPYPFEEAELTVPMSKEGFPENTAIGYRFKVDNKLVLDHAMQASGPDGAYNIAEPADRILVDKPRQMMHILPDSFYNKDWKDKSTEELPNVRTHFNKFGGNIQGIIDKLDDIKSQGFNRIISTPIFGQDNISSHGYWTTNPYQITDSLGNLTDFKKLQVESYKRGMGVVVDGAFVNEGVEGIHIKDLMLWGKDSIYKNWFETHNLGDQPLNFGVLPKQDKDYKYIGIKIINGPQKIEFTKNPDGSFNEHVVKNTVDTQKPTFVQIFDSRLASLDQMNNSEPIRQYAKDNTKDTNKINTYKDSVAPYVFRVDSERVAINHDKYKEACKSSSDKGSTKFRDYLTGWGNFNIVPSNKDGGISLWVGNKDISKFRFMINDDTLQQSEYKPGSDRVDKDFACAQYQVQDNIVQVGKFWTKEVARTLKMHTAMELVKGLKNENADVKSLSKTIKSLVDKKELPAEARDIIKTPEGQDSALSNMLNGDYELRSPKLPVNITDGLMDYPLDAIEFAPDLVSVLGSPYMKKLAPTEDTINNTRYETYKQSFDYFAKHMNGDVGEFYHSVDRFFAKQMTKEATKILQDVQSKNGQDNLLKKDGELTELGKEIYALIAPDIAKFLIVSSLAPEIEPKDNTEFLEYDPKELAEVNSFSLGLYNGANKPKDCAVRLLDRLKSGIKNIDFDKEQRFVGQLADRIEGIDLNVIKASKLIVDRTDSGLEWRIDAAKDVGDWESVSAGALDPDKCWNDTIAFWKKFNHAVREQNPNAYIVGELTDVSAKGSDRFYNNGDLELKFVQEAGFTTQSNYNYLYSTPHELYGANTEKGNHDGDLTKTMIEKLLTGWEAVSTSHNPGLLYSGPFDNIMYSHAAMGNHDKPRLLHTFALNMGKFLSKGDKDGDKAGAMKDALNRGLEYSSVYQGFGSDFKKIIGNAIDSLSKGKYTFGENKETRTYNPDYFGERPFDANINDVIKEASLQNPKFKEFVDTNKDLVKELKAQTLHGMIEGAMEKHLAALTLMVALPGNPTLYAGDELGETGYAPKCKNESQHNRSRLKHERLKDNNYKFLNDYRDKVSNIIGLRNKEALSPLVNGHVIPLETQTLLNADGQPSKDKAFTLYRYNDKTDIISVFHNRGFSEDPRGAGDGSVKLKKIELGPLRYNNTTSELPNELEAGITYRNALVNDGVEYIARNINGHSYVERKDGDYIEFNHAGLVLAREKSRSGKLLTTLNDKGQIVFKGKIAKNPNVALSNLKFNIPAKANKPVVENKAKILTSV